jgi:uncharacterized membrane protein YqhA
MVQISSLGIEGFGGLKLKITTVAIYASVVIFLKL